MLLYSSPDGAAILEAIDSQGGTRSLVPVDSDTLLRRDPLASFVQLDQGNTFPVVGGAPAVPILRSPGVLAELLFETILAGSVIDLDVFVQAVASGLPTTAQVIVRWVDGGYEQDLMTVSAAQDLATSVVSRRGGWLVGYNPGTDPRPSIQFWVSAPLAVVIPEGGLQARAIVWGPGESGLVVQQPSQVIQPPA